ncbi:hypothetical protein [Nocardioides caricicola]|uniref:Uncharacterized protein n=1 Tax=Nocardioides caricicola TaxID=634770 RepID=A0ABW0MX27_9ACTN
MRELVDAADGSPTPDELAAAEEYLALHATCEAYVHAQMTQTAPPERPRCAQGYGKSAKVAAPVQTKVCPVCNKQKSVLSFEDALGKCIKCKYKKTGRATSKGKIGDEAKKAAPTRIRKCPVCLQSVAFTLKASDWTVDAHTKATRTGVTECSGGGQVTYRERRDAMDHLVPGSFEGGKRR